MNVLDSQKLIRLRSDLGHRTSFVAGLVESFGEDLAALDLIDGLPLPEQASVVHRVTGSATMLTAHDTVIRLNRLETALRHGDPSLADLESLRNHLHAVQVALKSWIENAPPDGEPVHH